MQKLFKGEIIRQGFMKQNKSHQFITNFKAIIVLHIPLIISKNFFNKIAP